MYYFTTTQGYNTPNPIHLLFIFMSYKKFIELKLDGQVSI